MIHVRNTITANAVMKHVFRSYQIMLLEIMEYIQFSECIGGIANSFRGGFSISCA